MATAKYQTRVDVVDADQFRTAELPWPDHVDDCGQIPGPHLHMVLDLVPMSDGDWVVYDADGTRGRLTDAAFQQQLEPLRPVEAIEGVWVCSVNVTIQNPTNGQIRFNAATVEAATVLALHKLTDANVDYSAALETAVAGDVFYMQSAKDARRWARVILTADAARKEDAWYQIPIQWTQGSGLSFIEGNNKTLINLELSHRVDRTQVIP